MKPPRTARDLVERAKDELAQGEYWPAIVNAVVAIADHLTTQETATRGITP